MKILIVAFSESIHVARWINQLKGFGHKVYLFPSIDNGITNRELEGATVFHGFYGNLSHRGVKAKVYGLPVLSHLVGVALRMILRKFWPNYHKWYLRRVIKFTRPDIIHSMEIQHGGYLVNEVKKKWSGKFPKWIVTNWGSDIYLMGQFEEHRSKIFETLSACDYYSCECKRDIALGRKSGFSGKTLPVFPNSGGFKLSVLRAARRMKPSKRKLILVKGYHGWAGRAQVAIKALDLCGNLLKGYELAVYSIQPDTGVDFAARLLCEKHGLKLTIIPLGTSHKEILRYHGRARISIGLSISDAISTMVLEAMIMGSFPIQSNTSCANEWVKSGRTGIIVPPEDPEIIEKAIRRALTNDELVDKAAKENWTKAERELDSKIIKKKIAGFYQIIIKNS